jgi:hypothetical protein
VIVKGSGGTTAAPGVVALPRPTGDR